MPTRISYDGMSRLTAAGYLENGKRNDHFSTSYKYDLMGNILSLRREGLLNSGNYGTIDDLTYSYKGNQLVKIDDAAEESPSYRGAMHFRDYADEETEYTYDANGNMLTDSNKGITSIDYNVLDLPQCISTKSRVLFKEDSNDTIYYTYSADGTKLRSTYKKAEYRVYPYNPETSLTSFNVETGLNVGTVGMAKPIAKRLKTKYYYCSNLVYDNDNISAILFDGGYASVDDDNGIVMHFYVKDHLGSNRLVVDGNGNIEEVNHYYPFGALMGDRCGVSRNKYKYIGKELDTMYGWNMQDHEARWYDPVVGRWMATDPLQEKYASVSPYCYVISNPIKFIDPTGLEINMTEICLADEKLKLSTTQSVIKDLISQTGLQLSLDKYNKLQYAKNDEGKPVITKIVNNKGEEIDAGSKTARNFLVKMIDDRTEINVSYAKSSCTEIIRIGLNFDQISDMVKGAVGVDGNTLGFGMTFLHELHHTTIGGNYQDTTENFGTGDVVDRMNKIRNELNKQGFNYGERLNYKAIPSRDGNIIPFNNSALTSLKFNGSMGKKAYYIKIK